MLLSGTIAGCLAQNDDETETTTGPVHERGWSHYRADRWNSGFDPDASEILTTPEIEWTLGVHEEDDLYFTGAIADDTLYIGGDALRAVNVEDGTVEFQQYEMDAESVAGVAITDDLYVTGDNDEPWIARHDPSSGEQFERITLDLDGERPQPGPLSGPPTISGGAAIASSVGVQAVFDAELDEERWRVEFAPDHGGQPPVILNGQAYTTVQNGFGAFDIEGSEPDPDIQIDLHRSEWTAPASDGESIFVGGMGSVREWFEDAGSMTAVTTDGEIAWETEIGTAVRTPAVAHGLVFCTCSVIATDESFGGHDGYEFDTVIRALDVSDGEEIWSERIPDQRLFAPPPVVGGNVLYAGTISEDGSSLLVAFEVETGEHHWEMSVDDAIEWLAIAEQKVFVGTRNGTLYALSEPD